MAAWLQAGGGIVSLRYTHNAGAGRWCVLTVKALALVEVSLARTGGLRGVEGHKTTPYLHQDTIFHREPFAFLNIKIAVARPKL